MNKDSKISMEKGIFCFDSNHRLMIMEYNASMKIKHIYMVVFYLLVTSSSLLFAGAGGVVELNNVNFAQSIKSAKPVLVKFYSPNCPPCVMMAPEFAAASASVGEKAVFVEVNTAKYPDIAQKYSVHTVPTTVLFKNGKEIERFSSFLGREQLEQWALDSAK